MHCLRGSDSPVTRAWSAVPRTGTLFKSGKVKDATLPSCRANTVEELSSTSVCCRIGAGWSATHLLSAPRSSRIWLVCSGCLVLVPFRSWLFPWSSPVQIGTVSSQRLKREIRADPRERALSVRYALRKLIGVPWFTLSQHISSLRSSRIEDLFSEPLVV